MLSGDCNPVRSIRLEEVEGRVLDIVAETSGLPRNELVPSTPLAAALDSLTLAAVIARVEASFGVVLAGEATLELLGARDLRELCRAIARRLERSLQRARSGPTG